MDRKPERYFRFLFAPFHAKCKKRVELHDLAFLCEFSRLRAFAIELHLLDLAHERPAIREGRLAVLPRPVCDAAKR